MKRSDMESAAQSVGHFGAAARASGGISCERTINYHVSGRNAMNRWSFPFPVACWPNINLIAWPISFAKQLHAMPHAPCPMSLLNVARQAYAMHLGANTLCTHTHIQRQSKLHTWVACKSLWQQQQQQNGRT